MNRRKDLRGAPVVKVSVVICLGLPTSRPLACLAVAVIVPTLAVAAIVAALMAAIAAPIWLLGRAVCVRHRARRSILSLNRPRP